MKTPNFLSFFKKSLRNKNLRNGLVNSTWIIIGKILQILISLIVGILTARFLGPTDYGLISFSTTIITFFLIITNLGLENIIVKEISYNTDDTNKIIGTSIALRIFMALFSIIIILISGFYLFSNSNLYLVLIIMSSLLILKSFDFLDLYYQHFSKSSTTVKIRVVSFLVMVIYKIILLLFNASIFYFAATLVVEAFFYSLLIGYKFFRVINFEFSLKYSFYLLKSGFYFLLSTIFIYLYSEFDKFIIGDFLGTQSLGIYVSQISIANIWTIIPLALVQSFRPFILKQYKLDKKVFLKYFKYLLCLIYWIGILFTFILFLLGNEISLFLYGVEFQGPIFLLPILSFSITLGYLGVARNIWISAENFSAFTIYFFLIGSVSSIVMNLLFIRNFGLYGIAFTSLMTQVIILFFSPLIFRKTSSFTLLLLQAILFKF